MAVMKQIVVSTVLVVLSLFCSVHGQVVTRGSCPTVQVQPDFNITQYLGEWYEIEKFPVRFESGLKCINATYWLKDDDVIGVIIGGIDTETGEASSMEGVAWIPDPNVPAKLKVKFRWWLPAADYWVVNTNYNNYSVIYTCNDFLFGFFKIEFAWILSRDRTLDERTLADIFRDLQGRGVNIGYFQPTDQTGCVYSDDTLRYKPVDDDDLTLIFT